MLALRYLLVAAALTAAVYSGTLAWAAYLFRLDTANSVAAAVRLAPQNAAYVVRLAAWLPDDRQTLLRRAVTLNPYDSESLIQLGVLAEMQSGDPKRAERYYLRAAEVNRMFLPRWTLTNFYFRQQNPAKFFQWANEALQITPYSPDPVFAQMWLMNQSTEQLDAVVPDRPKVLLQYAWFLANSGRFSAVPRNVQRLVAAVQNADPRAWGRDDLIASMLDRMLEREDTADALKVWRTLKESAWIQQRVPDAEHPLTNGDFRLPFFGHGFDWAPVQNAGVRIDHVANGAVRITLNGDQPEHCVLLQQYVPLRAGADYALTWQAKSAELDAASGLSWHLRSAASNDLLAPSASWAIHTPDASQSSLLSLEYTRAPGHVRSSGVVVLESVSMAAASR